MRVSLMVLSVALWSGAAMSQTSSSTQTPESGKKPESKPAAPKRVRANLSGFELDKAPAQPPATQIGGATRGSDRQVALLAPRVGKAYDLNPSFRWDLAGHDASFGFKLMNEAGEPVFEQGVEGNGFRYPESAPALKPGQSYLWTVAPVMSLMGAGATPVKIVFVDTEERSQIDRELGAAGSPRARAQVWIDHRLWYDSVRALDQLIAVNPKDAELLALRAEILEQATATQAQARLDRERAESLQNPH